MKETEPSRSTHETEDTTLTEAQLKALLDAHSVPHDTWTQKKTPADLLGEILAGESTLHVAEGGLRRLTSVAWVDVYALDDEGRMRHLVEARQVFKDGRPPRTRQLPASLGEKLLLGQDPEDPKTGAQRALAEELGVEAIDLAHTGTDQREEEADSYPGLTTVYTDHFFGAQVAFNPDGFKEEQATKTTYFEWEPVT